MAGLLYYTVGGQRILVHSSETGWFEWLKRLFGYGKQTIRGAEVPQLVPNPIPANLSGGTQYTAGAAASEFGESFIGIVEIGRQGSRVSAGTYAKNVNHLTLSKQNLRPLQTGQRRFGFTKSRGGITIGPSSTGAIPTIFEISAIRTALQQQGYLTPDSLYLIVAEDSNGKLHVYNLMTGEAIP